MKTKSYLCMFAVLLLAVSCVSSSAFKGIEASPVDLSGKSDGVYPGEYILAGSPVRVSLEVTVERNRITAINIIKHTGSWVGRKAEVITDRIIEAQSVNVDVVSGSTASSISILKAVENALE